MSNNNHWSFDWTVNPSAIEESRGRNCTESLGIRQRLSIGGVPYLPGVRKLFVALYNFMNLVCFQFFLSKLNH